MVAPWWVCPLVAAIFYVALAYVLPAFGRFHPLLEGLGWGARALAPLVAVVVLFIGLVAAFKRWRGGTMLDRQKGTGTIDDLSWQEFEELLAATYRRQGYRVVRTGGGGADGGVDLVLHGDGETVLVQCKQWRAYKVGVQMVRELHGILNSRGVEADRAVFVTFGEYTQEARRFAEENSIELIGRDRLLKMVMSARSGSSVAAAEQESQVPFAEPAGVPSCPKCGKPMVLRTARRGANAGSRFWGCTGFPECSGIRQASDESRAQMG